MKVRELLHIIYPKQKCTIKSTNFMRDPDGLEDNGFAKHLLETSNRLDRNVHEVFISAMDKNTIMITVDPS